MNTDEDMLVIESGVSVPEKRGGTGMSRKVRAAYKQMKPGDSFRVPFTNGNRATVSLLARAAGIFIATRHVDDTLRVWMLEKGDAK